MHNNNEVPVGIKVVAIFYYLVAAVFALLTISAILAGGAIIQNLEVSGLIGFIVFLAPTALFFFVGRGLWKAKNWARIFVIIFSIICFILAIILLIKGQTEIISTLVIMGLIASYLLFSKKVKKAFS